ncbi:unnamed protein product [Amoebophrya sp. A25]|nr:unnamed protein product [Amoebophrya sp. A25]|eukprot:GSA25T00019414001.1
MMSAHRAFSHLHRKGGVQLHVQKAIIGRPQRLTPSRAAFTQSRTSLRNFGTTGDPTTTTLAGAGEESSSSSTSRAKALLAGSTLLLAAPALLDQLDAEETVPGFDPKGCRHDLTTYFGRVKHMKDITDISSLLVTDEELKQYQKMLKDWKKGKTYTEQETLDLWKAKKVVDATIHPVTGEVMFLPGRMCAYVPANVPITSGMLVFGPRSISQTVFWQWLNQSANVGCNYANRSGADIDNTKLFGSYMLACGSSVGVAIGLSMLVKRYTVLQSFGLAIPYVAVCTANAANMISTRMEEWRSGVPVFDKNGKELGLSPKAGAEGVWQTLVVRGWCTPLPFLLLPPIVMMGIRPLIPGGAAAIVAEVGVVTAAMYLTLPYSLALGVQTLELSPQDLEEKFQNLKYKDGTPVDFIYANKGL